MIFNVRLALLYSNIQQRIELNHATPVLKNI